MTRAIRSARLPSRRLVPWDFPGQDGAEPCVL